MSASNGVIRIGRKGLKKFAFGEDGAPFEVDVVVVFQQWIMIDEEFRSLNEDKSIPLAEMPRYHQAAVEFVEGLRKEPKDAPDYKPVNVSEALDFIARLREQWSELVDFFHPKSRPEPDSQDTSEVELRFSAEAAEN